MDRDNHYEAAFEAYLQRHGIGYMGVDETRRCRLGDDFVKNVDFIVYGDCGSRLVVDVKGRKYPGGPADRPRRVWECWATADDIDGLLRWQDRCGTDYRALLVFTYLLGCKEVPKLPGDLWIWRGRRYYLRAVDVVEYADAMRRRSPKWGTVCLPGSSFQRLARPFHFFTNALYCTAVKEETPF